MANVIVGERREGSIRIRSSGGIPQLDETYVFLVKSDNKNNSRFNVSQTPGLPIVGVTVSSFGLTVCQSKSCVRDPDNPLYWEVTCEFSSVVEEGQDSQDPQTDPTAWVPIYETKFERSQKVVTRDFAGNAVVNSAGQGFDNGLTISRFLPVWEFFQFEPATVSDEDVIERNEVVNSVAFRGRAIKTLLCTVTSSKIGYYYGTPLRLTQYSLKYDPLTWIHKRLDVGTVFKDGTDLKDYLSKDGTVIRGGLNGSGAKVTVGDDPAILEFDMYDAKDFNSFLRV
jgi:hypothetical protein